MKKNTALAIIVALLFPSIAYANTIYYGYFGTTTESLVLYADSAYYDDNILQVDYTSNSDSAEIRFYRQPTSGTSMELISTSRVSKGSGTITPPTGAIGLRLVSNDGGEIHLDYIKTTNPLSTDVYFTASETQPPTDGGGGCDGCALLSCPGWGDYMGKIDEIIGKIPPPPDWDNVAGKFRDTILPKLKEDMEDIVGTPKEKPTPPPIPDVNKDIPDKPTGDTAPGLEDSGFSPDDIKDSAPDIEERDDPSGGFDILNPIDNLPTQDEFKDNIPEEGDNIAPDVPDPDNPAPGAPEEQPNPIPSAPKDNEETAPVPNDDPGNAPTPSEPSNPAPTPGDSGGTAPIPGDNGGTAPIPGADNSTAPIPGADNSTAPLPKQDTTGYPTPK